MPRYGDKAAEITHGFLDDLPIDKKEKENDPFTPRIAVIGGAIGGVAASAAKEEGLHDLTTLRLQKEYRISLEGIVHINNGAEDLADLINWGAEMHPSFFNKGNVALVADEATMTIGRNALNALRITTVDFAVMPSPYDREAAQSLPLVTPNYTGGYGAQEGHRLAVGDE